MKFFFRKANNRSHPPVTFNSIGINKYHNHKPLSVYLDLNLKIKQCSKLIGLTRRLSQCPKEDLAHNIQIVC